MASAVAFIQWDNYVSGPGNLGLFHSHPVTYNSSQERLHTVVPGDRLWLLSRCPEDRQYYFVACLSAATTQVNPPGSRAEREFGRFALLADVKRSHDLGRRFPAEGLLRALRFEPDKPIKYGASLGQSMQAIRSLASADDQILAGALRRLVAGELRIIDAPFGLWTKCDSIFADYFLRNWTAQGRPLAFLLYDSPPVLKPGSPVFIHSDKNLRLLATFTESQFVAGNKYTIEPDERHAERERIWLTYRERTIGAPNKEDFDSFWERQNGVRSFFIMENLMVLPRSCPFSVYGRALEWGYPTGVGYRYLALSQCLLLLHCANLSDDIQQRYLAPLLRHE